MNILILNFVCHSAILIYRDILVDMLGLKQFAYTELGYEIKKYLAETYRFSVVFSYVMHFETHEFTEWHDKYFDAF